MRRQITLYDDQYNFMKAFNTPNLMIAFVNYMFEDIEPTNLNEQETVLFESLRNRMDNQKQKSDAGSKSSGGGRPRKTTEEQQNQNKKTTKKQQKNNEKTTKKQEDKDNISKDILLRESNILDKSNIIEDKSSITKEINNLILELKNESNEIGIVYEKEDERNFSKHILTAKEFGEFAEKIGQSRMQFAKNIMKASVAIKFWKGPCAGPKKIYQNYAEVYNKTMQEHSKQNVISIPTI